MHDPVLTGARSCKSRDLGDNGPSLTNARDRVRLMDWPEAAISRAEVCAYSIAAFWSIADVHKQQPPQMLKCL